MFEIVYHLSIEENVYGYFLTRSYSGIPVCHFVLQPVCMTLSLVLCIYMQYVYIIYLYTIVEYKHDLLFPVFQ